MPEPALVTPFLNDYNCMDSGARGFPLRVHNVESLPFLESGVEMNLSDGAMEYVANIGSRGDRVFMHVVAILHSKAYRLENLSGLRHGWPRIPLPIHGDDLGLSAALGERVADLLLVDKAPEAGSLAPLSWAGRLSGRDDLPLDPSSDLSVTARWGTAGKGGITMPSTGRLEEREYTDDERASIAAAAESLGISVEQAIELLGDTCCDVYLNDVAYWRCVPASVWRYTVGGYQVIKKWLSYRERALLGRDLRTEEARYVSEMVRRIAALVLMGPELDANYEHVKANVWEWTGYCGRPVSRRGVQ